MSLSAEDWVALGLSLRLALISTLILLVIGTPLAWWLSRGGGLLRRLVAVLVAMPLVLPPTVLGFYLLMAMGPDGPLGRLTQSLGLGLLPFSFAGLVVASVLYSLPFVVQPIQNAFAAIGPRPFEVAATLRAGPLDRFFSVALPLARPGFHTAAVLGFAHTLGEFGVVLMIGGNIPGETQVVSLQLYEHVEVLDYARARGLALMLLALSFLLLLLVYARPARRPGLGL